MCWLLWLPTPNVPYWADADRRILSAVLFSITYDGKHEEKEAYRFGPRRKKIILFVKVLLPKCITVFCMGYIWSVVPWNVTSSHFNGLIAILKANVEHVRSRMHKYSLLLPG